MKKITFTIALSLLIFSCEKEEVSDPVTTTTTTTMSSECECGVISSIHYMYIDDVLTGEAVLYNQCTAHDTTLTYVPQTNAGNDKEINDPHCLGVSW